MIKQLSIIVSILAISYMIEIGLDFPMPASIMGMILLVILLVTKIIKLEQVENISDLLLKDVTLFLIPLSIGIIEKVHLFEGKFLITVFILIISTIISIFMTALIMKLMLGIKAGGKNDK
ncbi:MAG: CidA/LrgA family protein [Tissierellia bacterium]|nr:CidA/LrgA family protein [Tissierellia bacterium]MDD4726887.1 CidA/LrgA family protein [Tissierellia bacterium]